MPHWTDRYVGTLYDEADCAELCARVAREVFGRAVQLPTDRTGAGRDLVRMGQLMTDFVVPVDRPAEGAVVVLRHGVDKRLWHVGTLTRISGEEWVLHAVRNHGSAIMTRVRELRQLLLHVDGYYKWI